MRSVMSKKLIFLLLAAVWVAMPSAVASLKYDTLTSADGLSNSSVNCIYQDSTLMMWFGTWDGLNAYNGYGFRTYKFAPDNANTISNNVIRNIVEEAKGILWVATDYGINRIDVENDRIERFYPGYEDNGPTAESEYDRARARKALMDAGFGDRLAAMPKGLDTMLYKDFAEDGVEVSGGEAQKIAIARALYKDAPFIILDEPTAALDPIAEAEIYEKFNAISGDRTAIYISHRLSSCRFCDEIAVFSDGQVIQQGTHQALLAQESGKYAQLWHAQAQYYTKQTPDADGAEN